jgi:hypothetical protein
MTPITRKDIQADLANLLNGRAFLARHGFTGSGKVCSLHFAYVDHATAEAGSESGDLVALLQVQGIRSDSADGFGEAVQEAIDEIALEEQGSDAGSGDRLQRVDRYKDLARRSYDPADLNGWTLRTVSGGSVIEAQTRNGWATLSNVSRDATIEVSVVPADVTMPGNPSAEALASDLSSRVEPGSPASLDRPNSNAPRGTNRTSGREYGFGSKQQKFTFTVLAALLLIGLGVFYLAFGRSDRQMLADGSASINPVDGFQPWDAGTGYRAAAADLMLFKNDRPIHNGRFPRATDLKHRAIVHIGKAEGGKWEVTLGAYNERAEPISFQRPIPYWGGDEPRTAKRCEFFIVVAADDGGKSLNGRSPLSNLFEKPELDALQADATETPVDVQREVIGKALARDFAGRKWDFHVDRVISLNQSRPTNGD